MRSVDMRPAYSGALTSARNKAYLRLVPLLFASYVVAYIDRVNIAFAKLTMSKDLPAFDTQVIAFGAGLFFLGYFVLEIPGTLIVERWSARKWTARIMISWGLVASLTAWVTTPAQFYGARLLLGLAEAGFFPGIIVFLTRWFTRRDRARAMALFLTALPVAQLISPLVCRPLLAIGTTEVVAGKAVTHPALWGLHGWQWVFVVSGIPAVLLGFLVLWLLTDRPTQASWLTTEERDALEAEIAQERAAHQERAPLSLSQALRHPRVLLLALAYFCIVTANYGTEFFLPTFLETWYKLKLSDITSLVALPPLFALAAQLSLSYSSDQRSERRWHTALPILVSALALLLTPLSLGTLWLTMALLVLIRAGIMASLPVFWTLPSTFLTATAAAGSIGLINSVGNLGGFLGPNVMGQAQRLSGSFNGGIWFLAGTMGLAAAVILLAFRAVPLPSSPPGSETSSTPVSP